MTLLSEAPPSGARPAERLRFLHPATLLFSLVPLLRDLLFFALLGYVAARGLEWTIWALLIVVPTLIGAALRYLGLSYRLGERELVVVRGIVSRQERHIPFDRIQNVEQTAGPLHRLLRVVELRLQTAGGNEPEAVLKVVSNTAAEELRLRIARGRSQAPVAAPAPLSALPIAPLLELSLGETILYGLLQARRGVVLLLVLYGMVWEWGPTLGVDPGRMPTGPSTDTPAAIALLRWVVVIASGLALVRVLSVIWALATLAGFRVTLDGNQLRTASGLLTRRSSTIPRHRVQVLSMRESWPMRWLQRAAVRVETAGGFARESYGVGAEWLAPLMPRALVATLAEQAVPGAQLDQREWSPAAPQAGRRRLVRLLLGGLVAGLLLTPLLGGWAALPSGLLLLLAPLRARLYAQSLGYSTAGRTVAFRSGWWHRDTSVTPFDRIQAVSWRQGPIDRWWGMSAVLIDTAGAGKLGHRLEIPYLEPEAAELLFDRLCAASRQAISETAAP